MAESPKIMRYTPAAVGSTNLSVARKPSVGAEKEVYATIEPVEPLGEFEFTATGSGSWTADPVTVIPDAGIDLVACAQQKLDADGPVVIWVAGTNAADEPILGSGTFTPPSYALNQTYDFQHGMSVDILVTGKFKTITAVNSGEHGKIYSAVKLLKMPENWRFIGCVEAVEPSIGTRPAIPHACGFDGSAFVTAGRSEPNNLTIRSKHTSIVDGLNRFAGRQASFRLDVKKSGVLITDRLVFGNAVLQVNPAFPDGNEEVADAGNGFFERYVGFFAP